MYKYILGQAKAGSTFCATNLATLWRACSDLFQHFQPAMSLCKPVFI